MCLQYPLFSSPKSPQPRYNYETHYLAFRQNSP